MMYLMFFMGLFVGVLIGMFLASMLSMLRQGKASSGEGAPRGMEAAQCAIRPEDVRHNKEGVA